jgi:hypothetical protein
MYAAPNKSAVQDLRRKEYQCSKRAKNLRGGRKRPPKLRSFDISCKKMIFPRLPRDKEHVLENGESLQRCAAPQKIGAYNDIMPRGPRLKPNSPSRGQIAFGNAAAGVDDSFAI